MSHTISPGSSSAIADELDLHLTEFLASLERAGYAERTRCKKRRAIAAFNRWVQEAELTTSDVDDAVVRAFLARPSRASARHDNPERAALLQFLKHLRDVDAVAKIDVPEPSASEALVQSYLDYLRRKRGLCARSIDAYAPFVRSFVAERRLPERQASLDAAATRGFLLAYSRNHSLPSVRLLAAALRSFLRFLFLDGSTVEDLSNAVPPIRRVALAELPPFLCADDVARVIEAIDRSSMRGRRALSIVLLLARLGLRANEVVTLELDDIRWSSGEIVVRGKGRMRGRLPLLDEVGEALACYLREARPTTTSRRVFLRSIAPHVGLSGPASVCNVARQALRRAGVRPAGRAAAHIFRHSLARQMIQGGASLDEISQALRHRSLESTQLYAKVEFEALREVTLPWPKAEVRP